MDKVYSLCFYSDNDMRIGSGFHIGFFATYQQAEDVALRYQKEVPGFKDYDCDYSIMGVPVFDPTENVTEVYQIQGWNWSDDYEETDCLISSCFVSKDLAEETYAQMRTSTQRQEWALNRYVLGQCLWADGFVRTDEC